MELPLPNDPSASANHHEPAAAPPAILPNSEPSPEAAPARLAEPLQPVADLPAPPAGTVSPGPVAPPIATPPTQASSLAPPPFANLATAQPPPFAEFAAAPGAPPPSALAALPVQSVAGPPPIVLPPIALPPSPFLLEPAADPPPVVSPSLNTSPNDSPNLSPKPSPNPLPWLLGLLSGVETGVLGALLMVLWFAATSILAGQRWWAMLNLYGGAIYGDQVFRNGFGISTAAGLASHILLQALGGVLVACLIFRWRSYWLVMVTVSVLGTFWYFICQFIVWGAFYDRIPVLTPQPATIVAHLFFTATLCRIPRRAQQLANEWQTA